MSLISKEDLIKAAGLDKIGFLKRPVASAIMNLTKINEVNNLYNKLIHTKGVEFFDEFIREQELSYIVFEEDLAKVPKTGPFIIVSNHPLGALDGILMCKILLRVRPDFKVMGNFLLSKIKPMEPFVISVNPFEGRKDAYNSSSGMRETFKHLSEGGCIGIFPAGEVSNKNNEYGEVLDRPWGKTALKIIKKAKVPVVPMYFHATNSKVFYNVSKLHPDLQTLMLPTEMMRKRDKPIRIRIGKPISVKQMEEEETLEELGEYLYNKVYMLKSYYEKRKSITEKLKLPNMSLKLPLQKQNNIVQNIIDETPVEDIIKEIHILKETENKKLFSHGDYDVFFTTSAEIPSIMREIGRQRELTFRAIGEGTNLPFDL
ncbi:MAG: glycerol acyltransferase, partial [Chryseobacterium sp.]|nr:glycerol acyltransferase [Chryseobacterium sp.]